MSFFPFLPVKDTFSPGGVKWQDLMLDFSFFLNIFLEELST